MSLRYKLNKDRFKGKKLPEKNQTNEEHISADQRGNHTSSDNDLLSVNHLKSSLERAPEQEEMSRRGLFRGLDALKGYSDKLEEKEQKTPKKKKRKKRKKITRPDLPGEGSSNKELAATPDKPEDSDSTLETNPSSPDKIEQKPKKGFLKRFAHRFYPPIQEKEAPLSEVEDSADSRDKLEETSQKSEPPVLEPPIEENDPEDDVEFSRRGLMRQSVHFIAKPAVDSVQKKIDKVNQTVDKITKRVPLLRPPGAIGEREFLKNCSRCSECIQACPKDAIQKVPKKMGFLIMDTPYIDPMKVPCVMCDGLPCISACPDKALLPVASPAEVEMGYVLLDKKKCAAYGDSFCQQCVIDCPIPGAISQKDSKPVFHKNICTGCGVCVRSCSTVNIPVALKVKPQMVIDAQRHKKQMEEMEAEKKAQAEKEALIAKSETGEEPSTPKPSNKTG